MPDVAPPPDVLRTRWADILDATLQMVVSDSERRRLLAEALAKDVGVVRDRYVEQLEAERDQYAAAARHMRHTVRHTAYVWSTTLPEMIRTADAAQALMRFASEGVDRPGLRDDLWQRIVGAYYVRFENDGHPEDSEAAADEAMALVQPEIDRLQRRVHAVTAEKVADVVGPDIELLCGEVRVARDAVARVRALHVYVEDANYCDVCSNHGDTGWPCATLRALDGVAS